MAELPAVTIGRIVKRKSKIRMSASAKERLRDFVEGYGLDVAKRAVVFAKHAKRKTVKARDIELALKK